MMTGSSLDPVFYVDGLPAESLPSPGSLALVQRTDGSECKELGLQGGQAIDDSPILPFSSLQQHLRCQAGR